MASEYESMKGQKAASAGRWPSTNPAPGGRPRNPFRTSPEVASTPVSGVPALPAPGEARNQMITQNDNAGNGGGVPRTAAALPARETARGVPPVRVRATPVLPRPNSKVSPRRGRWPNHRYRGSPECAGADSIGRRFRSRGGKVVEGRRGHDREGDHVLLGMEFLCAMGTTVRCGNAELILETVEDPTAEPVGPAVGVEDLSKGIPPLDGGRPRRRGGSRRARKAPWSSHRPASSRARTDETSKTQTVQPNSSIMAKIAVGEAVAAVDLQANGRRATVQDMGPWVESSPREEESPEAEAVWPEDLEPELQEFLEAELALFEELQGESHIAEHRIRLRDDKPLKQRYYPKNPAMQRVIDEQVNELIQAGAIEENRGLAHVHRLPAAQRALHSGCLSCPSD
ncbi:hypothetical protein ACLKA7_001265 [Drosophila subpalustris]